jgi:hypothetical protein
MKIQNKIIKASGEEVDFDESKLRSSLQKSGADTDTVNDIVSQITQTLHPRINTKEIYTHAYELLYQKKNSFGAKYKLKKAIFELGPTGFPFEKFIGAIIETMGYSVQVGVLIDGNCVKHEVDVLAKKGNIIKVIECKYHSDQTRKCDVKVSLYIHSRFEDIKRKQVNISGNENLDFQGWIYTNTKFTVDALQYGKCIGLNLISWNYPQNNGLKELIDKSGLHPITCLGSISIKEKEEILSKGVVLCKSIQENKNLLNSIGISKKRQNKINKEIEDLCFI